MFSTKFKFIYDEYNKTATKSPIKVHFLIKMRFFLIFSKKTVVKLKKVLYNELDIANIVYV